MLEALKSTADRFFSPDRPLSDNVSSIARSSARALREEFESAFGQELLHATVRIAEPAAAKRTK